MKIMSLYQENGELCPLEIELNLVPGLPGIQFLGLPDQHLKESATRIKNAIKMSGFDFPKTEQVLVNLRPNHIKKTSKGLELAVAAAFLWETEQVPRPVLGSQDYIYGELTLSGDVFEPEDLPQFICDEHATVWTGKPVNGRTMEISRKVIGRLSEFQLDHNFIEGRVQQPLRPQEALQMHFSQQQAELIRMIAVGHHSAFLAGAAGSGKTTLAKAAHDFLAEPDGRTFFDIRKRQMSFGEEATWRPLVKPHHTTPIISMVGGGNVPCAGEISRAHLGTLLLDEFFEFKPQVLEALRQPMEEKRIRIFRRGGFVDFPCDSLVIATTNLCPCGNRTPNKKPYCRLPILRCDSYAGRFTGPVIDRFEILEFLETVTRFEVSGEQLLTEIEVAREFREKRLLSGPLSDTEMERLEIQLPRMESERRRKATLNVARTFADLEGSEKIESSHLKRALDLTYFSFDKLRRWDDVKPGKFGGDGRN